MNGPGGYPNIPVTMNTNLMNNQFMDNQPNTSNYGINRSNLTAKQYTSNPLPQNMPPSILSKPSPTPAQR